MLKSLLRQFIWKAVQPSNGQTITKEDSLAIAELGFQSMRNGALEEAVRCFEIATRELPKRWDITEALGLCYLKLKRYHYALSCFQQLEEGDETGYLAVVAQADILRVAKRYGEALAMLNCAYAVAPSDNTLYNKLGEIHFHLGNYTEAKRWYEQCGVFGDTNVAVLTGYGLVFRELGELDKAHHLLSRANALEPDNPDILMNLALILHEQCNHDQALNYFQQALTLDPTHSLASTYRALTLLEQGKFGDGWDAYEARWLHPDIGISSSPFNLWPGPSEPSQSLFICSEQGIGDQIMFASCLSDVRKYSKKLIVECNDKLKPLFSRSFPWARVVTRSEASSFHRNKVSKKITHKVAIGSLPRFFRRNYEAFPRHQGYLKADSKRSAEWRRRFQQQNQVTVGISWRGGLPGTRRHFRSLDQVELQRLLSISECQFVNLQYDFTESELRASPELVRTNLFTDFDVLNSLDETAAVISAVDLVVTVQTAVAHLSGALNQTTWVMIPARPEWRYRQTGSTLPWYPSVRLFRQTTVGDWSQVLDDLCGEITIRCCQSK